MIGPLNPKKYFPLALVPSHSQSLSPEGPLFIVAGLQVVFFLCCREEINRSYKHMAVLLHPDKNLAPGSDEAFKCIAKAREELLKTR